jgi:hypothetical protein
VYAEGKLYQTSRRICFTCYKKIPRAKITTVEYPTVKAFGPLICKSNGTAGCAKIGTIKSVFR